MHNMLNGFWTFSMCGFEKPTNKPYISFANNRFKAQKGEAFKWMF